MEPESVEELRSAVSQVDTTPETLWASTSPRARSGTPSMLTRRSSLRASSAFVDGCQYGFPTRSVYSGFRALPPIPEPQMLRLRPASLRTQDISHLLARVFRNLYTAQVIGEDLSDSLIKARGSEDERHEQFLDQLQQVYSGCRLSRYTLRMQPRPREGRCPNFTRTRKNGIPSSFVCTHTRLYVANINETTGADCSTVRAIYKQRLDEVTMLERHIIQARARDLAETEHATKQTTLNVLETPVKLPPVKTVFRWCIDSELLQKHRLICVEDYYNDPVPFCSAPRGPSTPGYLKLTFSYERHLMLKAKLDKEAEESYRKPVDFDEFEYTTDSLTSTFKARQKTKDTVKMVIALQNTTATSRYLRVLPPSTPYFALGLGMFPGKGGMVAPGMTCQYVVQFIPDCLGDFDDFILVETQSAHTLVIPLQARRPPPVLTLSPVLDCGHCLIGGVKLTRFVCKNVGYSVGKFCIMPKKSWPPPSFRIVGSTGFVEKPPFGIMPSVFELAPGFAILLEVGRQTPCLSRMFRTGQLVALDLIYISGGRNEPEAGELRDLTAQYFIRFDPENPHSTARKQLIIRNATHVDLAFRWQIMKPNLQPLMPGETHSADSIKCHPDRESAFSIIPEKGVLEGHSDHQFILSFSPYELKCFHSVLQMVLEAVPEPLSSGMENLGDYSYSVDDVIVLEIEVKGSVEPFQVLLEPYALIIPGESYIGITVKKDFKMWNNSKSPIKYLWGKISESHIIEVEPCSGLIEPNEVGDFELNLTGGAPGPISQDLKCEVKYSPCSVVLHIEAAFKVPSAGDWAAGMPGEIGVGGPAVVIDVPALQFGLLRLGQKSSCSVQIRNVSQLSAVWRLKESPVCLKERNEDVSPFDIEPLSGQLLPLGECKVNVTLEASHCQSLQTVLELEVENGAWSYLPVYAEVQQPYVYLKSSHVELSNLYLGVPTKSTVVLVNGTLLPTRFHWGKLLGAQAALCRVTISPRRGLLGPSEERQLNLQFTANTREKLTDLALPCHVSGMEKPLALGISGNPLGLRVTVTVSIEDSDGSTVNSAQFSDHPEKLRLDFGSKVPLRTRVTRQLILTNCSPIQTPFTLKFEYFGSSQESLNRKTSLPDLPPALLKTARIQEQLAKREKMDFMENILSHRKGAAFFPHISQGMLGAHQQLNINITGCANMWGEYWDDLLCTVGDLPVTVIPVYMAVVGCPISSLRNTCYSVAPFLKEPTIRFGTQISGGDTVNRTLRLYNSSPCDIRLDWETYVPEEKEDRLLELLVFYGPPFPLRDQDGNELLCPETSEASSPWCPSPSNMSVSSHAVPSSGSCSGSGSGETRAEEQIISVILQGHEGLPSDSMYRVSPKQVVSRQWVGALWGSCTGLMSMGPGLRLLCSGQVIPAGGNRVMHIFFTPMALDLDIRHKVECAAYALGFMSLDKETDREIPGRMRRLHEFAVGPLRLDLNGYVRLAQLTIELDSNGYLEFQCHASDLIPKNPCCGVLSDRLITRQMKLINTTEILQYFRVLVSRPFLVSQGGTSCDNIACHDHQQCEEEIASSGQQLLLRPQENMLEVPLRAVVALPSLQLSTSWVDFGTCFVNQQHSREVYLVNRSNCLSYWTVLMGQEEPVTEDNAFGVSPSSGLLEARPTNSPPPSIPLQVFFNPRSSLLYESTMVVEGVLSEKPCTLRLRGRGSYDERYVIPNQL
ncbi:deleted in lung and esophageal cancer 1 [Cricetulus griseus]